MTPSTGRRRGPFDAPAAPLPTTLRPAAQMPKKLFLIDSYSQIFRAFHALPELTNADGVPTNAVYGFTTMLRKLLQEEQPDYCAAVFDTGGPTVRHAAYADYYRLDRNSASMRAAGQALAKLVRRELVSEQASVEMTDLLAAVWTSGRRVDGDLPPGTKVAHKTCTQHRRDSDLAII